MFRPNRYRRGPYALAEPQGVPRVVKALVWLIVLAVILWYLGRWMFGLFGVGSAMQRKTVMFTVEPGGIASVSIEGGLLKRIETGVPLSEGDRVTIGNKGGGAMRFFDQTNVRLDAQTDLAIDASAQGDATSTIALTLAEGTVWMSTPSTASFSGGITRTVSTPLMTVTIPSHAEAVISGGSLLVFSADGLGLPVTVGTKEPVVIGEGQKFTLPADTASLGADLYAYRSIIGEADQAQPFVTQSRGTAITATPTAGLLTITSPKDGATVEGAEVTVQGTVSAAANKVRVNGVAIAYDKTTGAFTQTLVPDAQDYVITVEALDAKDVVLTTVKRTVHKATASSVPKPAVTSPAKTGETYRTTEQELILRGTNAASIAGIMVNEYRLQLFTPGKGSWSYLASAQLGNMKAGTNVFNVYALDTQGNKSDPATITVIYDNGTLAPATGSGTSSSSSSIDETTLPQNDPQEPGSLRVTGPTAGTAHTATGSEFLLEGTTSANTASMWINGYKLQLYKEGKTTWNYIANEAFGNLKKGTNTYAIVARDGKDQVVDKVVYTVTY